MHDYLDGFEKRMQLVAVVESIVNRKSRKREIEDLLPDMQFENLIFSVLVFIMEKTLSEDGECDMGAIGSFIDETVSTYYGIEISREKSYEMAEYIVKTVLQFDGSPMYYPIMNYRKKGFEDLRIKLIDEKISETEKGYTSSYLLTDQGYDFLFRTKEVEQDLSFSVEEFKLRELIKRKNYKKALQQSNSLVQMVRQKKKDIHQFMAMVREDISKVEIARFEMLVTSTYDLLKEEYKILDEIMVMVNKSESRLKEEVLLSGRMRDDLKKAQHEIALIKDNLSTTLREQKELIVSKQNLYTVYSDTLKESFTYVMEKRFDLEQEVLRRLEQSGEHNIPDLWQLLNSIFMPNPFRHLNPRMLYNPQMLLKLENDSDDGIIPQEEFDEDKEKVRIESLKQVYIGILRSLLLTSKEHGGEIRFSRYIDILKQDEERFRYLTGERLLFTTVLKLYDMGIIDVDKWKKEKEVVLLNLSEEFSLEYCLTQLLEEDEVFEKVSRIEMLKVEEDTFEIGLIQGDEEKKWKEKIEITDFKIKVDWIDGPY